MAEVLMSARRASSPIVKSLLLMLLTKCSAAPAHDHTIRLGNRCVTNSSQRRALTSSRLEVLPCMAGGITHEPVLLRCRHHLPLCFASFVGRSLQHGTLQRDHRWLEARSASCL